MKKIMRLVGLGSLGGCFVAALLAMTGVVGVTGVAAASEELETATGTNVSGESFATDRREIFKKEKNPEVHIEVPRQPDGRPMRPVRGLSRVEKMEMDDLEYRFQQGQISEAEYFSKRNALMERLGLEAEY